MGGPLFSTPLPLLTFCGAEGFCPIIVAGFQVHSDLVQVAEASLTLVGTEEGEILLALGLRERVEDVMDLQGEKWGQRVSGRLDPESSPCPTRDQGVGTVGPSPLLTLIQTLVTSS